MPAPTISDEEIAEIDKTMRQNLGSGWQPDPIAFARKVLELAFAHPPSPEPLSEQIERELFEGVYEPPDGAIFNGRTNCYDIDIRVLGDNRETAAIIAYEDKWIVWQSRAALSQSKSGG